MIAVPKKVAERLADCLRPYVGILRTQRDRDVSEADTVTVVKDVLQDVFGFDKYSEVTGEFAIRGTRCDLAIKLDGKMRVLIEVKAIGLDLKDSHIKQAVDYAANQGVDCVILTNGIRWIMYHVVFKQPIDKEEVVDVDLLGVNSKSDADLERLYLLTKEGMARDAMSEYRTRKDATSRFVLAAILTQSDAVLSAIRKEVRRVSEILFEPAVIERALREEVIKRELLEGDQAADAAKRYARCERAAKAKKSSDTADSECAEDSTKPPESTTPSASPVT